MWFCLVPGTYAIATMMSLLCVEPLTRWSDPPSGRKRLVAQTVPTGSHGASASRASRIVGWPVRSRASKIDFDSVSITLQTATKSEQEPTSSHEIKLATQRTLPPFAFPQPNVGAV